jgi:hypothetical protein
LPNFPSGDITINVSPTPVTVNTPTVDEGGITKVPTSNKKLESALLELILEQRKTNIHLQAITDEQIFSGDLKVK